jgi:TolB protein
VSVSSSGTQGNGDSYGAQLTDNGHFVVFASAASNLVEADNNGLTDVFVRDLQAGRTKRVSVSSTGGESNGFSGSPLISANGRFVVFVSGASNLVAGDDNELEDIFVRDLQTGMTQRLFLDDVLQKHLEPEGTNLSLTSLSDDGRFVAFYLGFREVDALVSDLKTGVTQYVGFGNSYYPTLSANGRFVAFLGIEGRGCNEDPNGFGLRDLKTGLMRCLLQSQEGFLGAPIISADARFLAYSANDLHGSSPFGTKGVYVEDVNTLEGRLVSVNRAGIAGNGDSYSNDLSANGRFVAFTSLASDLVKGDNNAASDVFVRDLKAGVTRRVSVNSVEREGNKGSRGASISAKGHLVAFTSDASNLVKGDNNGVSDVFVRLWR